MLPPISQRIAVELNARAAQVEAAIRLLDEGATVPFVARYRKEATGGLDDGQLRLLDQRLQYLRELEERRSAVLKSIDEQAKLSPGLRADILAAETKTRLEDLYLPYKPKRRSKAQIAREAGLTALAERLLHDPHLDPESAAAEYLDAERGIADTRAALDGARQILMETFAEDAELTAEVREWLWEQAVLKSTLVAGKEQQGAKFSDYFAYREPLKKVPSHRALALFRGRNEGVLLLELEIPQDEAGRQPPESMLARRFDVADRGRRADPWLLETVRYAWRVKLFTRLDLELKTRLREAAEAEAIRVFARNLHDLLLAAPAGGRVTLGLDPGLRTGVKVAVIDATGQVVATDTIYPHAPKKHWDQSISTLARLAAAHAVELIAIGNGTASRETERLAADLIRRHPELALARVVVSEAGASVYSASELAARELPQLDVSLRGAASIARRLQDPLAELVKIEPKAIGVGQYQHDVSQVQLARSLDDVVEDCVNAVGVDLNTASPALLARVSGLSSSLAENLVAFRNGNGAFRDRKDLLKVPRLGQKTFEQAAGFLRIRDGDNPLDASAVHPEAYPLVERLVNRHGRSVQSVIGDREFLRKLRPDDYVDARFGVPTVIDILAELEKPGRDPRPDFKTAEFRDGVETLADLRPGMILEGVVSNVANFGAFVDIGVHQDGLVHVSALSERFVRDPREVVKTGQVVKVKVMSIDTERRRIELSLRLTDDPQQLGQAARASGNTGDGTRPARRSAGLRTSAGGSETSSRGALAEAFKRAENKK